MLDQLVLFVLSFLSMVIIGTVLFIPFLIVTKLAGRELVRDEAATSGSCVDWIMSAGMLVLYFVLFEGLYGRTPGKLILRMRVVKAAGDPCGLGDALRRALARFLDGIGFGLVAYLGMKFPLYQRLGDKWADTMVVDASHPAVRNPPRWWKALIATAIYMVVSGLVLGLRVLSDFRLR